MNLPIADKKIFVAGHQGMVGSAICRNLRLNGCSNLILRSRVELDLRDQKAVNLFFEEQTPDIVIVAAARVGGILANLKSPGEFIHDNLAIGLNVVHAAHQTGAERLLFLGSSCIYPKDAEQPISETCLLSGRLEQTNEAYAVAKIAILKLCEFYRKQFGNVFHSVMPCNLYGPGDNYHPEDSHVIPGLIRRFHDAKNSGKTEVTIWGSGNPKREFLWVDDLAEACVFLIQADDPPDVTNIGWGEDIQIAELAKMVGKAVGFKGEIVFDTSYPDGVVSKLMDSSQILDMGWKPETSLERGLQSAYVDFLENLK